MLKDLGDQSIGLSSLIKNPLYENDESIQKNIYLLNHIKTGKKIEISDSFLNKEYKKNITNLNLINFLKLAIKKTEENNLNVITDVIDVGNEQVYKISFDVNVASNDNGVMDLNNIDAFFDSNTNHEMDLNNIDSFNDIDTVNEKIKTILSDIKIDSGVFNVTLPSNLKNKRIGNLDLDLQLKPTNFSSNNMNMYTLSFDNEEIYVKTNITINEQTELKVFLDEYISGKEITVSNQKNGDILYKKTSYYDAGNINLSNSNSNSP